MGREINGKIETTMNHDFYLTYKESWEEVIEKKCVVAMSGRCRHCGLKVRLQSHPVGGPYFMLGVNIYLGNYGRCLGD